MWFQKNLWRVKYQLVHFTEWVDSPVTRNLQGHPIHKTKVDRTGCFYQHLPFTESGSSYAPSYTFLTTAPNGPYYYKEGSWRSEGFSIGKVVRYEPRFVSQQSPLLIHLLSRPLSHPPSSSPFPSLVFVVLLSIVSRVLKRQRSVERKNLSYRGLNPTSASWVT